MNILIEKAIASSSDYSSSSDAGIFALLLGGGFLFIWVIAIIIALAGLVLWIWALIDCLNREFPGTEKNTWIIVLVVGFLLGFGWLAAIIYLLAGKPKGIKKNNCESVKAIQGNEKSK